MGIHTRVSPLAGAVLAFVVLALVVRIVEADPFDCRTMCTISSWKSDACYRIDSSSCYYQRQMTCRAARNSTEEVCKTGAYNETCTVSLTQTCGPVVDYNPTCGNYLCEVGEPFTCPQDCRYHADGNPMVEGTDVFSHRCPGLNISERYFVLTLDDGPTEYTPKVLKYLNATNHKATFFLVGSNLAPNAGLVKDIVRDGHIIGSHTYSHFNISQQGSAALINDIANFDYELNLITGFRPRFLRPPYGSFTKQASELYSNFSMDMVTWNIDSFDYARADAEQITSLLENWIHENPGHGHLIYLGHDTSVQGADTVPAVISLFESKGFKSTTLDACLYGVSGPAVYTAPRTVEPQPVQKLVISAGADEGLSSTATRATMPGGSGFGVLDRWLPAVIAIFSAVWLNFH